jgi:hypothetical protein
MAMLAPGQVEYCTIKQDVTQDDFDNGTFVVAVTNATAAPRGANKELLINLDAAEVVQVDRTPALDVSCSVKQGWVAAAGEIGISVQHLLQKRRYLVSLMCNARANINAVCAPVRNVTCCCCCTAHVHCCLITDCRPSTCCNAPAGESSSYTIRAANIGTTRLRNVTISTQPPLNGLSCMWASINSSISSLPLGLMEVGASIVCTGSYTFDQATFEAGSLALQATATAKELSSAAAAQLVVVQPAYAPALKVEVLAAEAGVLPTIARECQFD